MEAAARDAVARGALPRGAVMYEGMRMPVMYDRAALEYFQQIQSAGRQRLSPTGTAAAGFYPPGKAKLFQSMNQSLEQLLIF